MEKKTERMLRHTLFALSLVFVHMKRQADDELTFFAIQKLKSYGEEFTMFEKWSIAIVTVIALCLLHTFCEAAGNIGAKVCNVIEITSNANSVDEESVRKKYEVLTTSLIRRKLTITTMESCTAGQVVSLITDTEGSSAVLKGAFVTYSNEAKIMQGESQRKS